MATSNGHISETHHNGVENSAGDANGGPPALDAVIVGAGFGGIYTLYKMRQAGFNAKAYETGSNFGGGESEARSPNYREANISG